MVPQPEDPDIDALFDDDELIDNALTEAVKDALRQHKLLGDPIVVCQDGKVVWIQPEDIEV